MGWPHAQSEMTSLPQSFTKQNQPEPAANGPPSFVSKEFRKQEQKLFGQDCEKPVDKPGACLRLATVTGTVCDSRHVNLESDLVCVIFYAVSASNVNYVRVPA